MYHCFLKSVFTCNQLKIIVTNSLSFSFQCRSSDWNSLLHVNWDRKGLFLHKKSAILEPSCCETPCKPWPHSCKCAFYSVCLWKYHKLSRSCTLNKPTSKQQSEMRSKISQKERQKNQSWPFHPQLHLQGIPLVECHGLFSLFFPHISPLRGGRMVWVYGGGHCPPTWISFSVTILATLTGSERTLWIKTLAHTENFQRT